MTLQVVDFDSCSLGVNAKAPAVPEKRTRLVRLLGAIAAVSGVSTSADRLRLTSRMPLPRSQDFFGVLIYQFFLGWREAELEELYVSPLCPSELGSLAPLQLSAGTVASVPCHHTSSGSASRQRAARRGLTHSLGLGRGTGKVENGTG